MKRQYANSSSDAIPVYADSAQSQRIGKLYSGSACQCIGEEDGQAIILYKISTIGSGVFKVGFADAAGISAM